MKAHLLLTCLIAALLAGGCNGSNDQPEAEEASRVKADAGLAAAKAEAEAATAARLKVDAEFAKVKAEADAARAARDQAEAELARVRSNKAELARVRSNSAPTSNSNSVDRDENVFVIRSGIGESTIHNFRVGNDALLYDFTILFDVKDGTKCKEDVALVGNDRFVRNEWARVTILDGTYRGKTGWVIRKWLH